MFEQFIVLSNSIHTQLSVIRKVINKFELFVEHFEIAVCNVIEFCNNNQKEYSRCNSLKLVKHDAHR